MLRDHIEYFKWNACLFGANKLILTSILYEYLRKLEGSNGIVKVVRGRFTKEYR